MQQPIISPGVFTNEGNSDFVLRSTLESMKGQQLSIPRGSSTPILRRMAESAVRIPEDIKVGTNTPSARFTPTQGSTTVAIGQKDLYTTKQVAIPARTIFRTSISLADRFKQPELGTTAFLPQYILSDLNTGYLNIRPSANVALRIPDLARSQPSVVEQGSTTPSKPKFQPVQGGVNPTPIESTPVQGETTPTPIGFTPEQGQTKKPEYQFTPTQGETTPTAIGFTPTQGGVDSTTFDFQPEQGVTEPELVTSQPAQGSTDPVLVTSEPEQGAVDPILVTSEPQQGGVDPIPIGFTPNQGSTDPTPIGFTPTQGSVEPTPIGFTPQQGETDPTPIGFTPQQGGATAVPFEFEPRRDAPVLNVLKYEADRLLALTLPRVKHGSENPIPFDYEPNRNVPQTVQPPTEGDITTQAAQLEGGNAFIPAGDVGAVGKYRTLSYGELQRAPRTSLNPIINTGTVSTAGISDVALDKDFVDLIINDSRFRAYITSFSDNLQASWNDHQYVGRQDVIKTFRSVTRNIALAFKTAAFTKSDLGEMYQRLSKLVNSTVVGRYADTYTIAPFSKITIGKWFVNTPCIVNSIKFDTQPTEYSWDVGNTRQRSSGGLGTPPTPSPEGVSDAEADSRQLPMIVDVSLEIALLGDASGNTWNGENDIFKLNG